MNSRVCGAMHTFLCIKYILTILIRRTNIYGQTSHDMQKVLVIKLRFQSVTEIHDRSDNNCFVPKRAM